MLAVPPVILDLLELRPGAKVDLSVEGGRMMVMPQRSPRYTLEQLLAQCDAGADSTPEEEEWVKSAPAGGELL